jgi:hypothetical protein
MKHATSCSTRDSFFAARAVHFAPWQGLSGPANFCAIKQSSSTGWLRHVCITRRGGSMDQVKWCHAGGNLVFGRAHWRQTKLRLCSVNRTVTDDAVRRSTYIMLIDGAGLAIFHSNPCSEDSVTWSDRPICCRQITVSYDYHQDYIDSWILFAKYRNNGQQAALYFRM